MPNTRLALVALVLSPLTLLPVASAQSPDSHGSPVQTITGQVMTAHDDTLVIETANGEERAFVMNANVTVPEEASPGRRVTVTYRNPGGSLALRAPVRAAD